MSVAAATELPPGNEVRAKLGKDDWIMRGFIAMIAIYLVVALALPLYAMLSKSFTTYRFDLTQYEFQISDKTGTFTGEVFSAEALNRKMGTYDSNDLVGGANGRLKVTPFFQDFSFRSPV